MAGKIGPHEGVELELLLKGDKPLAKFTLDGLDSGYEAEFDAAVGRGEILRFKFPCDRDRRLDRLYYCRHGEEWRVKILELLYDDSSRGYLDDFTAEDLHRIDGALLGYSAADIDAFLHNWRNRARECG